MNSCYLSKSNIKLNFKTINNDKTVNKMHSFDTIDYNLDKDESLKKSLKNSLTVIKSLVLIEIKLLL